MALEGANIAGQAQVYNQTQKAVDVYAKTLAQQQAKLAAEQKALQDDLAKVKVEGIRQADMPEFLESYNKAKEVFARLNATRNPAEKIRLKREFDESMLNTGAIGADSRALAKGEDAAAKMFMNPNIRDRYKEDAIQQFQLSKTLSRKDPKYIRDLSTLEQQVDTSQTMKDFADINKRLLASVESTVEQDPTVVGNNKGTFLRNVKKVTPEEQVMAYGMAYDVSSKLRAGVQSLFPKEENESTQEYKSRVLPQIVANIPAIEYGNKTFKANQRPRVSSGGGDSDGGSDPSNYTVEKDTYLYTKPQEDKDFNQIEGSEKQSIRMAKSVGFDTDYFPLIDAQAFDVESKKRNAKVSGNFIVGKLAYVPIEDGSVGLRAVVVNADGDKYVVKPDVLPIGIRKSKNYKTALKALGSAPPKASKSTVTTTKTETKPKQEVKTKTDNELVKIQLPNGQTGQVPKGQVSAFMKKYPKAKIVK